MDRREVRALLQEVAEGTISADDAATRLASQSFVDLGYAKPDLHRGIRQGVSEVIYGAGKTPEQIAGILTALFLLVGQIRDLFDLITVSFGL